MGHIGFPFAHPYNKHHPMANKPTQQPMPQKPVVKPQQQAFQPKQDTPKKPTPIRERKAFKELEREITKFYELWMHAKVRRIAWALEEEARILKDLSIYTYRAHKFIEDRMKKKDDDDKPVELPPAIDAPEFVAEDESVEEEENV